MSWEETMNTSAVTLAVLLAVSACGGSTLPPATTVASGYPPGPSMGLTERMPPDENGTTVDVYAPLSANAVAVTTEPDRVETDRPFDAERRPAELLTFLGARPGMRVAVLVAGSGYTADLLARAVAPAGIVYAENPRLVRATADAAWTARLAMPGMKNVVRVDRELDDPLPPEATDLDLVVINLAYHDTVWLGVDRERMNRTAYGALKSGGKYVVIDHSARPGSGIRHVRSLHRIDEAVVVEEARRVGFRLEKEGDFLRNPSDARDWNDSLKGTRERGDTSDRFAVMFEKP
jgi:predicted methyltransferase